MIAVEEAFRKISRGTQEAPAVVLVLLLTGRAFRIFAAEQNDQKYPLVV